MPLLFIVFGCTSPRHTISESKTLNTRINTNDSSFTADSSIIRLIAPYKSSLDSQMNVVVGYTEVDLIKKRPNGNLNNFIADVIRIETSKKIGKPVDFAFTNISGLRIPSIPKGNITKGKLFELMPFDNMIVAAKINGTTLKQVLQKIASKGGEAISGFEMVISTHGKLIFATYNGIKIDFNKDYIIATNDFLFNGGDNYNMFSKNIIKTYPVAIPIRDMVMNHIKKLSATNTSINPKTDERIAVQ
ncbi:MAG: 5'-nucleotidase C-terminal domain-containing protein [bacterium]